jgi:rhomboid protease GluP
LGRRPSYSGPSDTGTVAGWIPHARFTTVIILTVNIGLYLATTIYSMNAGNSAVTDIDPQTLSDFGAKRRDAILLGQWWRLITAGFLHGGLFHILMNSWILFDLGALVEEVYGARRLIVFYFVATVTGFMASTWWSPYLSIGASAGIFGLIGAMIAFGLRDSSPMATAIRGLYVRWALYGLLIGLLPFFRTDNAAHLGGLAGGFAAAYVAGVPSGISTWRERFWGAVAGLALGVTVLAFARMYMWMALGR